MSIRLVRGFLKNISVLIYDISTLSYDTCTGFADWHLERSSSSWATSTREKFLSKHCCVLRMRAHTSWTVDRASQKVRENSKFSSPDSDHHYNVQRLCFRNFHRLHEERDEIRLSTSKQCCFIIVQRTAVRNELTVIIRLNQTHSLSYSRSRS